ALGTTFMATGGLAQAITISVSAAVFANWLMMALMNVALIVVRVQRPELRGWFRYPGNIGNIPVLAVVAAIAALWVLTFLDPLPLAIGVGWIVLITVLYFAYARS